MRIAVADDEPDILHQMVSALDRAGHNCDGFADGHDLLAALQRDTYDVVLLDWNMPRASGMEVLEWSKASLENPPAFVLITSRSDQADVISALQHGATDYLVKPQPDNVVVARTEAAAKSANALGRGRSSKIGVFEFDHQKMIVSVGDKRVQLTSEEFNLAKALFGNVNRPVSRHYLTLEVWGKAGKPEPKDLDRLVSSLRHKASIRPANGFAISTIFGFGYRMDPVD